MIFKHQEQAFLVGDFILLASGKTQYLVEVTGIGNTGVNGNYLFKQADAPLFSVDCHDEPKGNLFGTFPFADYNFIRRVESHEEAKTLIDYGKPEETL